MGNVLKTSTSSNYDVTQSASKSAQKGSGSRPSKKGERSNANATKKTTSVDNQSASSGQTNAQQSAKLEIRGNGSKEQISEPILKKPESQSAPATLAAVSEIVDPNIPVPKQKESYDDIPIPTQTISKCEVAGHKITSPPMKPLEDDILDDEDDDSINEDEQTDSDFNLSSENPSHHEGPVVAANGKGEAPSIISNQQMTTPVLDTPLASQENPSMQENLEENVSIPQVTDVNKLAITETENDDDIEEITPNDGSNDAPAFFMIICDANSPPLGSTRTTPDGFPEILLPTDKPALDTNQEQQEEPIVQIIEKDSLTKPSVESVAVSESAEGQTVESDAVTEVTEAMAGIKLEDSVDNAANDAEIASASATGIVADNPLDLQEPVDETKKTVSGVSNTADGDSAVEPSPVESSGVQEGYSESEIKDYLQQIETVKNEANLLMIEVEKFMGSKQDREYLHLSEMLMRQLYKLDSIESKKNEEIKKSKKDVVLYVKDLTQQLETKVLRL